MRGFIGQNVKVMREMNTHVRAAPSTFWGRAVAFTSEMPCVHYEHCKDGENPW